MRTLVTVVAVDCPIQHEVLGIPRRELVEITLDAKPSENVTEAKVENFLYLMAPSTKRWEAPNS